MKTQTDERMMEACIENCLSCHKPWLQMSTNHGLETGGDHTEPSHFRLMINCAEICQTSANFMLSGSDLHHLTCGVYAQICEKCAENCEGLGEMDECVSTCRRCA